MAIGGQKKDDLMRNSLRARMRFFVVPALVSALFYILGNPWQVGAAPGPYITDVTITNGLNVGPNQYFGIGSNLDIILTYNENVVVTNLTPSDTPSIGVVVGLNTDEALYESGSGTSNLVFSYTVTTADSIGEVTLESNLDVSGGATITNSVGDLASNTLPDTNFGNVIVDGIQPVVTFIGGPNPVITNASGSVTYAVRISDTNLGILTLLGTVSLSSNDIAVTETNGAAVGSVEVAGYGGTDTTTNFLVTLSGFTGNGTVWIDVIGGAVMDLAGNTNLASTNSAPFTVDSIAPTVDLSGPSTNIVNQAGTVTYQVSISDINLNEAASFSSSTNIHVTAPGAWDVAIESISTNATNISFTVALSGLTGSGSAFITIPAGVAVDLAGNANSETNAVAFTVDNNAPSINIGPPSVPITNASGQVSFSVTYADPSGFQTVSLAPADIVIVSNGIVAATSVQVTTNSVSPAVTPTNASYTVTLSGFVGNGGLQIYVTPGNAVDVADNAAPSDTSLSFLVDTTPPSVEITNLPPTNSVNATGKAAYTLILSDSNLDTNGIAVQALVINATGSAKATDVTVVTNSLSTNQAVLTVTLSGFEGNGTLGLTVPGGFVRDLAGNANVAETSITTFSVDAVLPQVVIIGPSASLTTTNPVSYTLVYQSSHPLTTSLSLSDIKLNSAGSATGTLLLTGSSNTWTVTITNITGNGTLGISVAAGTATNSVGNVAPAAGPSSVVVVGNSGFASVVSARFQASGLTLSTAGLPGATYLIESATNLIDPQWESVGQTTANASGEASLTIIGGFFTNPAVPFQFYRAVLQP
jgi:hypothetical protein